MTKDKEIREEKRRFTRKLEELLKADPRSGVSSCEYFTKEAFGSVQEYIEIKMRSGNISRICVTGDSLGMIIRDITKKVYHSG